MLEFLRSRRVFALAFAFSGWAASGQTGCERMHHGPGLFICYPDFPGAKGNPVLPRIFHLSAQANAFNDRAIGGYKIWIDNRLVDDVQLSAPRVALSLETNVKSPFTTGVHTLRLEVDGAGTSEIRGLEFSGATNTGFCDPFDARSCILSPGARDSLQWSATRLSDYLTVFTHNLESLEADTADAAVLDRDGNRFVAFHAFSDVELRKYAPDGSLLYSSLIRSCSDGCMSITGLDNDKPGGYGLPAIPTPVLLHLLLHKRPSHSVLKHGADAIPNPPVECFERKGVPALPVSRTEVFLDWLRWRLLSEPVAMSELLLAPGERADILVDFRGREGRRLTLMNHAAAPFPAGGSQVPGLIMQFRVTRSAYESDRNSSRIPDALVEAPRVAEREAIKTRRLTLVQAMGAGGQAHRMLLDGKRFMDPITEDPVNGTTEIWEFVNPTIDAHPIHIHAVHFPTFEPPAL